MGKVIFNVVLPTTTKMFCGCPVPLVNEEGEYETAGCSCPVCRGEKGAYPVLNKKVVEEAIAVILALGGTVTQYTLFDRVRNEDGLYRTISQYSYPIGKDGKVLWNQETEKAQEEAESIAIQIMRLKESEEEKGIPLLEITAEDIREEQNSYYIEEVEKVLLALGMEEWEIIETDDVIETLELKSPLSYLPDPDIPPVIISKWWTDQIAAKYPDFIHIEEPEIEDEDDF